MIYGEMVHTSHSEHKLKLAHIERPYKCNGCGEMGFHTCYTCEESSCNFHLHKDCASPSPTMSHPFFPNCEFVFLESGEPDRYCDGCGRDINGFVYHCIKKRLDLHPCCATLPYFKKDGDLELNLRRKVTSKCYKCRKKQLRKDGNSWSYVSTCNDYHFHVSCVKDMLLESWEKEYICNGSGKEASDGATLVSFEPKLQIVLDKGKKKSGRFAKYIKIAKIVIAFVIAAVVGDPTSIVITLITSLISH